jgi:hypothetical protein
MLIFPGLGRKQITAQKAVMNIIIFANIPVLKSNSLWLIYKFDLSDKLRIIRRFFP